jgi:hypothetical protein
MKRFVYWLGLVAWLLNACAATPATTDTGVATATNLPVTPVESAFAPANPTAAPLDEILAAHQIDFMAADGTPLKGELYGSGSTAVIFSVMGNCSPGWREFAQLTAAQGLLALTYQWRGCGDSGVVNDAKMKNFVDDLREAWAHKRSFWRARAWVAAPRQSLLRNPEPAESLC